MPESSDKLPTLGTIRECICPWCTEKNRKATRRQHTYRETRGWRSVSGWWECSVCGHRLFEGSEILRE
jgi:hypothetical protein